MIGERFYKQIAYRYSPLFDIDYDDLMEHIYKECPSLRDKEFKIIEGKKVYK